MLVDLSLWSADLTAPGAAVRRFDPHVNSFHFDVADGHFVPSLLFFPDLVRQLRPLAAKPFHVHLMTEKPEVWVEPFVEAGADIITVHAEAAPERALELIARSGKRAGLAMRLETPLEAAAAILDRFDVDSALLLGTPAGVKGCGLGPDALHRLRAFKADYPFLTVFADGAIRRESVSLLAQAGAGAIVPGSLVFGATDPEALIRELQELGA
jgi:ribulose-phosphate 3-epimerase